MVSKNSIRISLGLLGFLFFLLQAQTVFAKSVLLSGPNSVEIGADKYLKLQVNIDTSGETVGAVEFDIPFNTEILSGKPPEVGGSVCNFIPIQQPNHIMCGFYNGGFKGSGLLATLVFQGKAPGADTINVANLKTIFNGTVLSGYDTNSMGITVYGVGQKPTPTSRPINTPTPAPTLKITPVPTTSSSGGSTSPSGSTSGYETQVPNPQGSTPEDPLSSGPTPEPIQFNVNTSGTGTQGQTLVKDLFSDNQKALLGFFPTIILLILVIQLAIKLYFTEKRRRMELEKLFEDQLGSLASLESKLDLLDQKGDQGKERFIQEFESTKSQLLTEVNPTYQP